jgi:hypothetical protein
MRFRPVIPDHLADVLPLYEPDKAGGGEYNDNKGGQGRTDRAKRYITEDIEA